MYVCPIDQKKRTKKEANHDEEEEGEYEEVAWVFGFILLRLFQT